MANLIATLHNQVIVTTEAFKKLSDEVRAKLFADKTTLPLVQQGMEGKWLTHLFMKQPFEEDMIAGLAFDPVQQPDGSVTVTLQLWDTEAGFAAGQRLKQPTGWLHLSAMKTTDGQLLLQADVFDREDVDSTEHQGESA